MKTIVVLGAGLASATVIRQVMRNVVLKKDGYKLVVVAPNTHLHWTIAMPRVIVPGLMSEDKAMLPLSTQFSDYPADKFESILGVASDLDTSGKVVTATLNGGGATKSIKYDTLIIATGSSGRDDIPWKILDTTEKTKERLHQLREDIKRAKTILVAGGGQTGTETAGELGSEYAKAGKKEIHFVYNEALPLSSDMLDSVRKQAKTELERFGVKLVPKTTVTKATRSGDDTIVELKSSDGSTRTITVGAYIPATGLTPNSAFAKGAGLLDSNGYIKQTRKLQAEGHDDIFVIGDVGNLESNKAQTADAQGVHLIKALPEYLLRGTPLPEYKLDTKGVAAITLGPNKATGQMFGWKAPGFLFNYVKGRTMFTDAAPGVAAGKKSTTTTFEK